jgi:ribose transport system permease protein
MMRKVLQWAGLLILPVFLYLVFTLTSKGFGLHSFGIVLSQAMIPAIMGFSMTITMRMGMFDLSPGAQVIFAAICGGLLEHLFGFAGLVTGCIGGGLFAGLTMALLYRTLKIPSMVISLGFMLVFEVIAARIAGSSGYIQISQFSAGLGGITLNYAVLIITSILFYLLIYRTKLGCHIQAVGNDEKIAKNMGMDTALVKFKGLVFSGFFCGLASILQIRYSGTITAQIGLVSLTMIFKPIIGVVIGLQLVKLIDNLPVLILIGEVSISIIFNGFIALGMTDTAQNIVLGAFLIIIMALTESRISLFPHSKPRKTGL